MSFLRPALAARLRAQGELWLALGLCGLFLLIALRSFGFLALIGLAGAVLSALWALAALWRARFRAGLSLGSAPGLVEWAEGEIRYFGPEGGGALALADVVELRLWPGGAGGHPPPAWRLKDRQGQALLVPLGALGGEALFDALAQLPGLSQAALAAAAGQVLPTGPGLGHVIWRRPAALDFKGGARHP